MTQLPTIPAKSSRWDQALYAFPVEKGNRSGSRRTVESYSRMLWHFFKGTTLDQVTPAVVLAYAHGIGLSGKPPSPVTIGARIACLSSYFKFLQQMGLVTSDRDLRGQRQGRAMGRRCRESERARYLDDPRSGSAHLLAARTPQ